MTPLINLPLTSINRHLKGVERDGWLYDSLGFRFAGGIQEQTDRISEKFTLSLLSGETTNNARLIELIKSSDGELQYLVLNEQNARYVEVADTDTQVKLPVIIQTKVPDRQDIEQGKILLGGINVVDFAADGNTLEVEIQTDTTFRWRQNGGSWTSGVTIDFSVPLGSTGLTLYFLLTTGFTASDVWEWTRTSYPYSGAELTCLNFHPQLSVYNRDVYISGVSRNILRLRNDLLTSVGYTRIFGKYVTVFQNHLVVGQFSQGQHSGGNVVDGYDPAVTPYTVGWSHLNDPDQFFASATLGNEPGTFQIPSTASPDLANVGITGLSEIGGVLYIYRPDGISAMSYVGLPIVMQVIPVFKTGSIYSNGLVSTPFGDYFIGRTDFYQFDGTSSPRPLGKAIREKFFSEAVNSTDVNFDKTFGYYDPARFEVCWIYYTLVTTGVYQLRKIGYQIEEGRWFFQNMPTVTSSCKLFGTLNTLLYTSGQKVYGDCQDWETETLINDRINSNQTTDMTNPFLEWHWSAIGKPAFDKSIQRFYYDIDWDCGGKVRCRFKGNHREDDGKEWVDGSTEYDNLEKEFIAVSNVKGRKLKAKLEIRRSERPTVGVRVRDIAIAVHGLKENVEA